MVSSTSENILDKLKQSAQAGLSFEQAKEKLLSEGYIKQQIKLATDNYEYGGAQTTNEAPKIDRDFTGGWHAPRLGSPVDEGTLSFVQKFAKDVGVPFWLLFGLTFFLNLSTYLLVGWLGVDSKFDLINGALTLGLVFVLIDKLR
jgi:hypothetical protein